jgi:transcriptional regulator with XRE-family HTH domain
MARQLPRRIRHFRRAAGLKGIELAAAIGMVPSSVSQFERGRRTPDIPTCERIAAACGVDLQTLLHAPIEDTDDDRAA